MFSHNFSSHFLRMIVCMKNQITSKIILLKYIEIHSMALGCESAHAPAAAGGLAEKTAVSLGGRDLAAAICTGRCAALCVFACGWVGLLRSTCTSRGGCCFSLLLVHSVGTGSCRWGFLMNGFSVPVFHVFS